MICHVFKPRRRVGGVLREARHFSAKLRMDWEAKASVVALGTPDRRIASKALETLAKERYLEHQGYLAPRGVREAAQKPLKELLDAFLADAEARGRSANTLAKYRNGLTRLFGLCGWNTVHEVSAASFCDWRSKCELSPKSKNDYLLNTSTFLNWLQRQGMSRENPLKCVGRVDTSLTPQFRRALSPQEAQRLLAAAPSFRAVVYLVLLETGLRRSELQQLVWADFELDTPSPFVRVRASITKTKKEATLPLRAEVVKAIRSIAPRNVTQFEPIFRNKVPRVLTLKKDLVSAGIPFQDNSGRRIDLHALRETFCTNLSVAGVYPRVAMELMRHRDIRQTMKTYTDTAHLPLAAAVAGLPILALPARAIDGRSKISA
jgi:integrase